MNNLQVRFCIILAHRFLYSSILARRSIRSCRLSIVKPKPSVEKPVEQPIPDENEVEEEEDPSDVFQVGDIVWARVVGNPWWPALIYGKTPLSSI